jgi:hypothetical protein
LIKAKGITAASADGDFTPAKRKKRKIVRRPYPDYGFRYQRTPGFTRGTGWPW